MKNILVRTLGGGNIGYGHFFRCFSLSKALIKYKKDIKVIFLINDNVVNFVKLEGFEYIVSNSLENDIKIISNLEIDLFILDTYLGDNDYLKMVKEKAKIMLIDDNNDIYDSSLVDIIYNGNIHAYKLNYPFIEGQTRLLGVKYLIMKDEYWYNGDSREGDKESLLITTGGSDEHGIAIDIIREVRDLDISIKVIIGPGYKDDYIKKIEYEKKGSVELIYSPTGLKEYIKKSEIVITAGGSTIYEVLSQKTVPIIFSLTDNQDLICKELEDRGISYLGKYPNINFYKIKYIIQNLKRKKIACNNIFNLVDGKGAFRIKDSLLEEIYKTNP